MSTTTCVTLAFSKLQKSIHCTKPTIRPAATHPVVIKVSDTLKLADPSDLAPQELAPITSYDTAGTFLLLGSSNGSIHYIDMQKFPLRMKDNDLLVTELYRDPNADSITAISVYLTPKTTVTGNWIEIAYGTSSGVVRVIVQHPETVGHGPQLFQVRAACTAVSFPKSPTFYAQ